MNTNVSVRFVLPIPPIPGPKWQSGQAAVAGSARSIWVRYKCRLGEGPLMVELARWKISRARSAPGACNWVESGRELGIRSNLVPT